MCTALLLEVLRDIPEPNLYAKGRTPSLLYQQAVIHLLSLAGRVMLPNLPQRHPPVTPDTLLLRHTDQIAAPMCRYEDDRPFLVDCPASTSFGTYPFLANVHKVQYGCDGIVQGSCRHFDWSTNRLLSTKGTFSQRTTDLEQWSFNYNLLDRHGMREATPFKSCSFYTDSYRWVLIRLTASGNRNTHEPDDDWLVNI